MGKSEYARDRLREIFPANPEDFLNPEGHQNHIIGSKVTIILLKGLILPIGGDAFGSLPHRFAENQEELVEFAT